MSDSQNAKTKCFSGIISRLLLCRGSLPTHPSDHIAESNTTMFSDLLKKDPNTESKIQQVSATTPGIVARLMGLETLPDLEWVPKARISESFARSRSVNSMDYLIEFNPQSAQHRRVRTSVSFREVPTVLSQQSQEYFVFYLENVNEAKEQGSKLKKSEMGFEELDQKKAERGKNKEEKNREKALVKKKGNAEIKKRSSKGKDEPRRVSGRHCSKVGDCHDVYRKPRAMSKARSSSKTVQPQAVPAVGLKFTEKKKKKKIIQPTVKEADQSERDSKKSNPVSVVDIQDFFNHHEHPLSEDSSELNLISRTQKIQNFEYPSPHITRVANGDGIQIKAIKNKEDKKTLKINGETENLKKMMREICRLTEADIKEPSWVAKEVFRFEYCEEVCVEFGQQILDQLLHQVVYELSGYHM